MKVGFIGLGHMGAGMAANLLRAGHEVTVYNRTPGKAQALVEQGAHAAAQVADACRGEAVITMLADDGAVESVVFGDQGVIASLGKGAIHISMSTISVALIGTARRGAREGRPAFRRRTRSSGGRTWPRRASSSSSPPAPDAVDACGPLFDAIGQKTFTISDEPQAANLVKLSGNFLIASVIEALGEAMALVGKAGIDPHQYLDLLTSTLFTAPVYETYGELIAEEQVRARGVRRTVGIQRYPPDARRGGNPSGAHATGEPVA